MNSVSQQLTKSQWVRVKRLVEKQCANYTCEGKADTCLHPASDDYGCGQIPSMHLCCRYFMRAVLPLDPALEAELTGTAETRKCAQCGKPFVPASNRAKYCPECAERAAKQKHAQRQRKYRDKA